MLNSWHEITWIALARFLRLASLLLLPAFVLLHVTPLSHANVINEHWANSIVTCAIDLSKLALRRMRNNLCGLVTKC